MNKIENIHVIKNNGKTDKFFLKPNGLYGKITNKPTLVNFDLKNLDDYILDLFLKDNIKNVYINDVIVY